MSYLEVEPFSGVEIHMEMDIDWKWSGNGAQFVKILWIGLDLGQSIDIKPYDRYRTFTKHDKSNTETRSYPKNTPLIDKYVPKLKD